MSVVREFTYHTLGESAAFLDGLSVFFDPDVIPIGVRPHEGEFIAAFVDRVSREENPEAALSQVTAEELVAAYLDQHSGTITYEQLVEEETPTSAVA